MKGNVYVAYSVSKKYAEKAAWDFMENEKPHFDLIALNAPGVFGFDLELREDLAVVRRLKDLLRYRTFEAVARSFSHFLLTRISRRCLRPDRRFTLMYVMLVRFISKLHLHLQLQEISVISSQVQGLVRIRWYICSLEFTKDRSTISW